MPRPADRLAERWIAAWLLALCGFGMAAPQGVAGEPPVDPKRARLATADIKPAPTLPPVEKEAPSPGEPPEAAREHLDSAAKSLADESWTEAVSECEKALRLAPNWVDAHLMLARAALQQGNLPLARSHLDQAGRTSPRDARVYSVRGRLQAQAGETTAAIESLRLALMCDDAADAMRRGAWRADVILARLHLALALEREGYLAAAREQIEKYLSATHERSDELRKHPELKSAMVLYADRAEVLLSELCTRLGEPAAAAAALARAIQANPDDPSLRQRWARALAAAGRGDEAIEAARERLAAGADRDAVMLLEDICRAAGRPEQADAVMAEWIARPGGADAATAWADRLTETGRFDQAFRVLRDGLKQSPGHAGLMQRMADACVRSGRWNEFRDVLLAMLSDSSSYDAAMAALDRAAGNPADRKRLLDVLTRENGGGAAVAVARARLLEREGQAERATAVLEQVFDAVRQQETGHDGSVGGLCAALASRHLAAYEWPQAEAVCRWACEHGFRSAAMLRMQGEALDAQDEFLSAEAAYREAAQLDRRDARALKALAALLERRDQSKRARQVYRDILSEVDPRDAEAHEALIRGTLSGGAVDQALEQYREMKRLGISGPAMERCTALIDTVSGAERGPDRLRKYGAALKDILSRHPDDAASRLDLAFSYMTARENTEALATIEELLSRHPSHVAGREVKVELLTRMLRWDEAMRLVDRMVSERPRRLRWRETLKEMALNLGDDAAAVSQLDELLKRDDLGAARTKYLSELLILLAMSGRHDEAVRRARAALDAANNDATFRALYAAALERAGRFDEAVAEAREMMAVDAARSELREFYIGRLLAAGRAARAAQEALLWFEDEPQEQWLGWLLSAIHVRARDYDQAIALIKSLGVDAARPGGAGLLLEAYESAGRFDEAINLVQGVIQSQPGQGFENVLAGVYVRAGRFDDAARLLNRLLEPELQRKQAGQPFDLGAAFDRMRTLAHVYERMGQSQRSESLLEEIFELLPSDPGINNDLGYTWADRGEKLDKAEEMIRLAVASQPREPAYLDSMGWVLYKKGQFDEAVIWLERALRWSRAAALQLPSSIMTRPADPVDVTILDHAGDALYRLGQKEQASAYWREAVEVVRKSGNRSSDPVRDTELAKRAEAKCADVAAGRAPALAPTGAESEDTRRTSHDERGLIRAASASNAVDAPVRKKVA